MIHFLIPIFIFSSVLLLSGCLSVFWKKFFVLDPIDFPIEINIASENCSFVILFVKKLIVYFIIKDTFSNTFLVKLLSKTSLLFFVINSSYIIIKFKKNVHMFIISLKILINFFVFIISFVVFTFVTTTIFDINICPSFNTNKYFPSVILKIVLVFL